MISFLPIARYRVEYQIASGRPFSSFERLLLRAVKEGHGDVARLSQMFGVHRRLVIEGLVTLMQAGWVSLGTGDSEFVLSRSGENACDEGALPPTIALSDRQITIVVEKVTGQVARSNEIDFHTKGNLRSLWDAGVSLRKGYVSNIVDPALISPLLPHQPTEWIRWIGPISVLSDNAAFAVVEVDTGANRLTGVPRSWHALLLPECLREVGKREQELLQSGRSISEDIDRELRQLVRREIPDTATGEISDVEVRWPSLSIDSTDVLWSPEDHNEALSALIGDALTYVALSCSELPLEGVADLSRNLEIALEKGLLINIFLDRMPNGDESAFRAGFDALKKIAYDSAHGKWPGRLVLGTRGTGCQTNIAVADTKVGGIAILGSRPWTAPSGQPHLSIRFRDPWAVARICEVLAGFSAADERLRLEAGFVRLRKAAGDLRQIRQTVVETSASDSGIRGRLLLDRDHRDAIFSMAVNATKGITVSTDDLIEFSRTGWLDCLVEPSMRFGPTVRLIYGGAEEVDVSDIPLLESMIKNGITLDRRESATGTILAADGDEVILTSVGAELRSARQSYSARIGIAIKGADVVRNLFGGF